MTCSTSDIVLFVDGEADPAQAERMRVHLANCESCRSELRQTAELVDRLHSPAVAACFPVFPVCQQCGKAPAVCLGGHIGDFGMRWACDSCCDHGCEDRVCCGLDEIPQRMDLMSERIREQADEIRNNDSRHIGWSREAVSAKRELATLKAKLEPLLVAARKQSAHWEFEGFVHAGLLAAVAEAVVAFPEDPIPEGETP
jgi:hypothetical protein